MREASVLLLEGIGAGSKSLDTALSTEVSDVTIVNTGNAALNWLVENPVDLIVFDASSMRSTGTRTCRRIRRERPYTPIIHCRNPNLPEDRSAGADVYLQQPFTPRKLKNRIRALLPADDLKEEIIRSGKLTFYLTKRSVEVKGRGESRLTPKLASLLELFLRNPNEVIARHILMKKVWDTSYLGDTRTLDVHIRWIREIVENNPANPQIIKTIRGIGYLFSIPPK